MTVPNSDDPVPREGKNDPPPKEPPAGITLEQLSPEALDKVLEEAKVSDQAKRFAREAQKYRKEKRALAAELETLKAAKTPKPDPKANEELADLRHAHALNRALDALDFMPGARAKVADFLSDVTLLGEGGSLLLLDEEGDTEIPADIDALKAVIPHDLLATRASGGSGQASIREVLPPRPKAEDNPNISQAAYDKMTPAERRAFQAKFIPGGAL